MHLKDRGIGVLITDHNVRETLDVIDRAYIIYDGMVLTEGDPSEMVVMTTFDASIWVIASVCRSRGPMALMPRLDLRQTQSLVMTPQLQQAIKLLQFSSLELAAYVETQLEQNPLLDRDESDDPSRTASDGTAPRGWHQAGGGGSDPPSLDAAVAGDGAGFTEDDLDLDSISTTTCSTATPAMATATGRLDPMGEQAGGAAAAASRIRTAGADDIARQRSDPAGAPAQASSPSRSSIRSIGSSASI